MRISTLLPLFVLCLFAVVAQAGTWSPLTKVGNDWADIPIAYYPGHTTSQYYVAANFGGAATWIDGVTFEDATTANSGTGWAITAGQLIPVPETKPNPGVYETVADLFNTVRRVSSLYVYTEVTLSNLQLNTEYHLNVYFNGQTLCDAKVSVNDDQLPWVHDYTKMYPESLDPNFGYWAQYTFNSGEGTYFQLEDPIEHQPLFDEYGNPLMQYVPPQVNLRFGWADQTQVYISGFDLHTGSVMIAIPEPSTCTLLLVGFSAVALSYWTPRHSRMKPGNRS